MKITPVRQQRFFRIRFVYDLEEAAAHVGFPAVEAASQVMDEILSRLEYPIES